MNLRARLWTEEEFAAGRETWQELLANSDADPLFMGWDWQWTWWRHHRAEIEGTLQLVAVTDSANRLLGLAPLYRHEARVKRVVRIRRLECLGTAWHNSQSAFSEYFDVISAREHAEAVVRVLGDWLTEQRDWDDWILSHIHPTALVQTVAGQLSDNDAKLCALDALPTHVIDLSEGAERWLGRLSSDVRRRLHHQRSRLKQPGFRRIDTEEIALQLERLQQWRETRYGDRESRHTLRTFEHELVVRLAASGALRLSELAHRGKPLSVMLDARLGDTEYYLSSAFTPDAERGLSPGYLHFGYAIEAAGREGVKRFDLLAGRGRNRDYKVDLGGNSCSLRSIQVLRAPILRALHGLLDFH